MTAVTSIIPIVDCEQSLRSCFNWTHTSRKKVLVFHDLYILKVCSFKVYLWPKLSFSQWALEAEGRVRLISCPEDAQHHPAWLPLARHFHSLSFSAFHHGGPASHVGGLHSNTACLNIPTPPGWHPLIKVCCYLHDSFQEPSQAWERSMGGTVTHSHVSFALKQRLTMLPVQPRACFLVCSTWPATMGQFPVMELFPPQPDCPW